MCFKKQQFKSKTDALQYWEFGEEMYLILKVLK